MRVFCNNCQFCRHQGSGTLEVRKTPAPVVLPALIETSASMIVAPA
jgi:hypothetical protein